MTRKMVSRKREEELIFIGMVGPSHNLGNVLHENLPSASSPRVLKGLPGETGGNITVQKRIAGHISVRINFPHFSS